LDQDKAIDPEWHELMVNVSIDFFEMSYEESVSYFKRLENLEIRLISGLSLATLPVDNKNLLPVM
jgi:hypothetical protein